MCRARSDKERYAKLSIVVEESDETLFWLEIASELKLLNNETIEMLIEQATEFVKVTSAYRKKLSNT